MPPLLSYQPGLVATVKPGALVRTAPSLIAQIVRQVELLERQVVVGFVKGEPTHGSNRWLMWGAGGAFEYTHEVNVDGPPVAPMADCSDLVNQAVAAAVSAASGGSPGVPGPDPVDDDDEEPAHDVL